MEILKGLCAVFVVLSVIIIVTIASAFMLTFLTHSMLWSSIWTIAIIASIIVVKCDFTKHDKHGFRIK